MKSRLSSLLILIAFVISGVFALVYRQTVVDHIIVWQYKPTEVISQIADRAQMNDTGKFYFYASQPTLDGTSTFSKKCGDTEGSTAILGCYANRQIYIYDIQNPQLDGIKEVTAAHEMLHAAYDRLSSTQKQSVDTLVEAEYERHKEDAELKERLAFYDRTEPGERLNELHSIIATEFSSISPELESYYRTYFKDRASIVSLHTSYVSVFSQLSQRADELTAQLKQLGSEIEADSLKYNADVNTLNNDIQAFNTRAQQGGFTSQDQFISERTQLSSRARELDDMRSNITKNIASYQAMQRELETIASRSEELNKSIDSSLAPSPSL